MKRTLIVIIFILLMAATGVACTPGNFLDMLNSLGASPGNARYHVTPNNASYSISPGNALIYVSPENAPIVESSDTNS